MLETYFGFLRRGGQADLRRRGEVFEDFPPSRILGRAAAYAAVDKSRCMRTSVYLPSYVEWLTCLEMERDVRKMDVGGGMKLGMDARTGVYTLPRVRPALNW